MRKSFFRWSPLMMGFISSVIVVLVTGHQIIDWQWWALVAICVANYIIGMLDGAQI